VLNVIVVAIDVVVSLLLILLILLHAGKGGGLSDMFGGGGGLSGGTSLEKRLDKVTVVTASAFMVTSIFLAYQSARGRF